MPLKTRSKTPSLNERGESSKSSLFLPSKLAVILSPSASSALISNATVSLSRIRASTLVSLVITGAVFLRISAISFSTTASVVVFSTRLSSLVTAKSKIQASLIKSSLTFPQTLSTLFFNILDASSSADVRKRAIFDSFESNNVSLGVLRANILREAGEFLEGRKEV